MTDYSSAEVRTQEEVYAVSIFYKTQAHGMMGLINSIRRKESEESDYGFCE